MPFTGRDQENLLCFCHVGDKEWTRVAYTETRIIGHLHPDAPKWEADDSPATPPESATLKRQLAL